MMTYNYLKKIAQITVVSLLFVSNGFASTQEVKPAEHKLNIITTIPDFAWLADAIGQPYVTTASLLTGEEDPHYVDAMPSYIQMAANADIVFFVGLGLEIGWLPKVLERSGNANVQPGGTGHAEIGKNINPLQVISAPVDRSMGDIHPQGNPHFWLSPSKMEEAAEYMFSVLAGLDTQRAEHYAKNLETVKKRLQEIKAINQAKIKTFLAKSPIHVIEYHQEFVYFFADYGITSAGSIEEKPGVLPSAGRIVRIALEAKKKNIVLAFASITNPKSLLDKFSQLSQINYVQFPTMMQRHQSEYNQYDKLQSKFMDALIQALKNK